MIEGRCRVSQSRSGNVVLLLLLGLSAGCFDDPPAPDAGGSGTSGQGSQAADPPFRVTAELVSENNRGAGLMEQYDYSKAMAVFQKLVDDNPGWLDAKVNLAIAVLQHTQKGASAVDPN